MAPGVKAGPSPAVTPTAAQQQSAANTVIGFDDLPQDGPVGVVISSQYPSVTFSSTPGSVNYVSTQPEYQASPPNFLCSGPASPRTINCQDETILDFTSPASGLTFKGVGINDTGQVASVDVFQGGTLAATVPVIGHATLYDAELQDLTAFGGVTRIRIHNITDGAGIGWDDFAFNASGCEVQVDGLAERDNPCNAVPNTKPTPAKRLYVSVESSGRVQLQLKTSSMSGDSVWGLKDGTSLLPESGRIQAGGITNVDFTPTRSLGLYTLAVGCDENGDGRLQASEIDPSLDANAHPFTIQAITAADYASARFFLGVAANVPGSISAKLLRAFLDGVAPAGSSPNGTVPVAAARRDLTHVAGEHFGAGCIATARRFTFYENSDVSRGVEVSQGFSGALRSFVRGKKAEVQAYFQMSFLPVSTFTWSWNGTVGFGALEPDLLLAFGTATMTATVTAVVRRDLTVQRVVTTGALTDIYDFNFEGSPGPLVQRAATVEIGWNATPANTAGRIFVPQVRLASNRVDMADALR